MDLEAFINHYYQLHNMDSKADNQSKTPPPNKNFCARRSPRQLEYAHKHIQSIEKANIELQSTVKTLTEQIETVKKKRKGPDEGNDAPLTNTMHAG